MKKLQSMRFSILFLEKAREEKKEAERKAAEGKFSILHCSN